MCVYIYHIISLYITIPYSLHVILQPSAFRHGVANGQRRCSSRGAPAASRWEANPEQSSWPRVRPKQSGRKHQTPTVEVCWLDRD